MHSKKRKLNDDDQIIGAPSPKRHKSNQIISDPFSDIVIFHFVDIQRIILDYLPFANNLSLLIKIGNDEYCQNRFGLTKNAINKVENYLNKHQSSSIQYHFGAMANFFGYFQSLFGDNVFHKLLTHPINGYDGFQVRRIENFTISDTRMYHYYFLEEDNDKWEPMPIQPIKEEDEDDDDDYYHLKRKFRFYVGELTIKFDKNYNLNHLFNAKQILFLLNLGINLPNCTNLKIARKSGQDKYEILPKTVDRCAMMLFGYFLNPTRIGMIPIWMIHQNKKPEFHTKVLEGSFVDRIWLILTELNDDAAADNGKAEYELFLDHNDKYCVLESIFIVGDTQSNFKNSININCDVSLSETFGIVNVEPSKCDIKWNNNNLQQLIVIDDNEIDFINHCKGEDTPLIFNNDTIQFGVIEKSIVEEGLLEVKMNNDIYYFKPISSKLYLWGCCLSTFKEYKSIHIKTSNIPSNWRRMCFGDYFNGIIALLDRNKNENEFVTVEIDGFSSNIKEFSITKSSINVFAQLKWDIIPDSMEFIRFPYSNYNYISEILCPFIVDKTLKSSDIEYKKVEIRFYEMMFGELPGSINNEEVEIDEYKLEKLMNTLFNTSYENCEIRVFRRKYV